MFIYANDNYLYYIYLYFTLALSMSANSPLQSNPEFKWPGFLRVEVLRRKIRLAEEPDNPGLLRELFALDVGLGRDTVGQKRARVLRQFHLLCETVEDVKIADHWRELCLNYLYRPLYTLQQLSTCEASKEELKALFAKTRQLRVPYTEQ